jgi:hypothetical protein
MYKSRLQNMSGDVRFGRLITIAKQAAALFKLKFDAGSCRLYRLQIGCGAK